MNPAVLLAELHTRGVTVVAQGGHLRCRGPVGALTPDLRAAVAENRVSILARLDGLEPWSEVTARRLVTKTLEVAARAYTGMFDAVEFHAWDLALAAAFAAKDLGAVRAACAGYRQTAADGRLVQA